MKKIAYLLTLIMLLVPLAGCVGGEIDGIEGDWYREGELQFQFNRNGTVGGDGDGVLWSTDADGVYLTIYFEDSVTTQRFEVRGNWLFILDSDDDGCKEFSRANIGYVENEDGLKWQDVIRDQEPYPSFCNN